MTPEERMNSILDSYNTKPTGGASPRMRKAIEDPAQTITPRDFIDAAPTALGLLGSFLPQARPFTMAASKVLPAAASKSAQSALASSFQGAVGSGAGELLRTGNLIDAGAEAVESLAIDAGTHVLFRGWKIAKETFKKIVGQPIEQADPVEAARMLQDVLQEQNPKATLTSYQAGIGSKFNDGIRRNSAILSSKYSNLDQENFVALQNFTNTLIDNPNLTRTDFANEVKKVFAPDGVAHDVLRNLGKQLYSPIDEVAGSINLNFKQVRSLAEKRLAETDKIKAKPEVINVYKRIAQMGDPIYDPVSGKLVGYSNKFSLAEINEKLAMLNAELAPSLGGLSNITDRANNEIKQALMTLKEKALATANPELLRLNKEADKAYGEFKNAIFSDNLMAFVGKNPEEMARTFNSVDNISYLNDAIKAMSKVVEADPTKAREANRLITVMKDEFLLGRFQDASTVEDFAKVFKDLRTRNGKEFLNAGASIQGGSIERFKGGLRMLERLTDATSKKGEGILSFYLRGREAGALLGLAQGALGGLIGLLPAAMVLATRADTPKHINKLLSIDSMYRTRGSNEILTARLIDLYKDLGIDLPQDQIEQNLEDFDNR